MTTSATMPLSVAGQVPLAPDSEELVRQLAETNRKLDILVQQVGHLHQRYQTMEELKDELLRIAKDGMAALTVELGAVEHEFNTDVIIHLVRKLVRSTPRLIKLFDMLETVQDLGDELGPLGKEVMRDLTERLATFEQRGYFRLAKGGMQILDHLVAHTSQEDLDLLAQNVTTIVDTVKHSTQPSVLHLAEHAVEALGSGEAPEPVGLWGTMRALRDPEVQQGVGIALAVLREVARSQTHAPDESHTDR